MHKTQPTIFLLLILLLSQLSLAQSKPIRKETKELVKSNTEFALKAYAEMSKQKGNIFFSPFSLSAALAMVLGGAKGATADQIAEALSLSPQQKNLHAEYALLLNQLVRVDVDSGDTTEKSNEEAPAPKTAKEAAHGAALGPPRKEKPLQQLFIANALWGQKGLAILPTYQNLLRTNYNSEMQTVDFVANPQAAADAINVWAGQHTNERIKNLMQASDFNRDSVVVLANAIYFRAQWQHEFNNSVTKSDDFWINKEQKISVPMMRQIEELSYFADGSLQGIELPYEDGKFSMMILLPNERDGLVALEKQLSAEKLEKWLVAEEEKEVKIFFPKFELEANLLLNKLLSDLGMSLAFQDVADFSRIAKAERGIKLSAALQKTFVKVDEEGTEATAVTSMRYASAGEKPGPPAPPPIFRADHPFIFLIRETATNSILFLGRVTNPNDKSIELKTEAMLPVNASHTPKKFVNEEDQPQTSFGKTLLLAGLPVLAMIVGLIIFRKKIFG